MMKTCHLLKPTVLVLALALFASPAPADDQTIGPGVTISDTRVYDDVADGVAPAAYTFDQVEVAATANVTVVSSYEVVLKPGTSIKSGAAFLVTIRDVDGLPNRWEMQYFGTLAQDPSGDFDGDGLTNLQEYLNNTDPSVASGDHDGDGLPDVWEVQYGSLSILTDRDADNDGDGISNWIEYKLGTNPLAADAKAPGIYYQYDKLGRIQKIERIPSR